MKRRAIFLFSIFLLWFMLLACQQRENSERDNPMVTGATTAVASAVTVENEGSSPSTAATAAVATPQPSATPMPTPTATPGPRKTLTVCMQREPGSLYLYGSERLNAQSLRHALYDAPFTTLDYGYQPLALEKIPSVDGGDVVVEPVTVASGDTVVDAQGNVVALADGVTVKTAAGETTTYDSAESTTISLPQMTVAFTFKPLVWADGTLVTAADSVFSFELATHPDTPGSKTVEARTASYQATGERSVRWTGLPGYVSAEAITHVWTPLPRHRWERHTPALLTRLDESNRQPLGYGPFMVEEWVAGDHIRLVKNPNYYRAGEGLPYLDEIVVRFLPQAEAVLSGLAAGDCDLVTQETSDSLPETDLGEAQLQIQMDTVFEHIDFGVNSYDDGFERRPDWFEDTRVRQAITLCTDRERMAEDVLNGRSPLYRAYIPDDHPLHPDDLTAWPYDPARANVLLDEVGYVDTDDDGIRQDPESGTPFSIVFNADLVSNARRAIGQILQENLAQCGIDVDVILLPPAEWYEDGPIGPLFGRQFDLGAFAWLSGIVPPCQFWLSTNITGPESEGYGGWGNVNVSGWANEEFDAACRAALSAVPGTETYRTNHQAALRIFNEQLPAMPLFGYVKAVATGPGVFNVKLNPSQPSEFWNVFKWDVETGD